MPASDNCVKEVDALQALAEENRQNGHRGADMILTFGPDSGSFFADAFSLKRYRWANLPAELENAIQKNMSTNGYGKIHDISINSHGGWVMQTKEGAQFQWGGRLPKMLEQALSKGSDRRASIAVMLSVLL